MREKRRGRNTRVIPANFREIALTSFSRGHIAMAPRSPRVHFTADSAMNFTDAATNIAIGNSFRIPLPPPLPQFSLKTNIPSGGRDAWFSTHVFIPMIIPYLSLSSISFLSLFFFLFLLPPPVLVRPSLNIFISERNISLCDGLILLTVFHCSPRSRVLQSLICRINYFYVEFTCKRISRFGIENFDNFFEVFLIVRSILIFI